MRRRWGVTGRIALLTTAVATVAVLVAALLSYGLVRGAAESEARRTLSRQADLVADSGLREPGAALAPGLRRAVRNQGIEIARVGLRGQVRAAEPAVLPVAERYAARLARGTPVSAVAEIGGETWYVEGRPIATGAVVLVQRQDDSRAFGRQVLGRTALALAVGLAVAVGAGVLLARRFSRSLRRTAAAAHRLAAGARQVRAPVEGPAELAEVAASLNALAAALETSEGRQREFLLSVSHELRTPLTAIAGFAESLADGVVTGDDTRAAGATIQAEAARLERLVTDLLDLARLGAQDFRLDVTEVDLTGLVAAAATVWRARCEAERVPFAAELPERPVAVRTDPVRTRQILDGLAENALRVTPSGRPVVLALHADAEWAALEVRDGGPGLTADDQRVAFDRGALYERYRGVRRVGTGVGLALVHGLATRLGGVAAAGTAPEGGARFTVWLPVAGPTTHAVTEPLPRIPAPAA